ncbi:MAG TPA: lipopolysaccharide biosynthesis protein [Candidatus Krumholzibacteria bacterium]|nr:lipopolysaccharide biosynthesis protein [Candidatus Krumholzibacteria bacterium]
MSPIDRVRHFGSTPAAAMAAANASTVALNLVQGFLFARILGPEDYGVWLGLLLLFQYGQYSYLGATTSVLRQIPLQRGRRDEARARRLTAAAHGLVLTTNVGWVLLGAALAFTVYGDVWFGALALVGLTVLEIWLQQGQAELKGSQRFHAAAGVIATRGVVNLILLPLVVWLGLEGAYLRWFVLATLLLVLTWRFDPVPLRWRFDRADFAALIRDGGPILMVGVVFAFQVHCDRTLLLLMADDVAMGHYGIAAILMTVMMAVPAAVGQTSYPGMVEEFGRTGRTDGLWRATLRRTARVGGVAVFAAGCAWVLLPPFVRWVLPDFAPGTDAARFVLPGTVFLASSVPVSYFVQTIGRQGLHVAVNLVALTGQAGLGVIALQRGTGIEGLAVAMSIGFAVYLALLTATASRARFAPRREAPVGEPGRT